MHTFVSMFSTSSIPIQILNLTKYYVIFVMIFFQLLNTEKKPYCPIRILFLFNNCWKLRNIGGKKLWDLGFKLVTRCVEPNIWIYKSWISLFTLYFLRVAIRKEKNQPGRISCRIATLKKVNKFSRKKSEFVDWLLAYDEKHIVIISWIDTS